MSGKKLSEEAKFKRWKRMNNVEEDNLDEIDPSYKYSKMYRETHGEE